MVRGGEGRGGEVMGGERGGDGTAGEQIPASEEEGKANFSMYTHV